METPTNISYVVGEHAPLAQSGLEQGTFNPRVVGSNPTRRTVVGESSAIDLGDSIVKPNSSGDAYSPRGWNRVNGIEEK